MPVKLDQNCNVSQVFYILQELSDTTNLGGPILVYGLLGSLEHAKLTAIKSAFGLDIIQSTLLCQNTFGPRKSNLQPLLFFKNSVLYIFWIHKFCNLYYLDR